MALFQDIRQNTGATDHNFVKFDTQNSLVRNAIGVGTFQYPLVITTENISAVTTFILSNKDTSPADDRSFLASSATPLLAYELANKTGANSLGGMGVLTTQQIINPLGAFRDYLVSYDWIDTANSTGPVDVSGRGFTNDSLTPHTVRWNCVEYNPTTHIKRVRVYHSDFTLPADAVLYVGKANNPNGTSITWQVVESYFDEYEIDDNAVYLRLDYDTSVDFQSDGSNGFVEVQINY